MTAAPAPFAIGDRVWLATFATRTIDVPCPVCFNAKAVTLVLGNGEEMRLECDYCSKGFASPRGFVVAYEASPAAHQYMIDRVSVSATDVEYQSDCTILRGENVFATEAEALDRARDVAVVEAARRESQADYAKAYAAKSFSWNAGYHLTQAKDQRKKAEYHERMASICKARAKEVKP